MCVNVCVCSICSGSVLLSDLSFLDLYYCYIALYIYILSFLILSSTCDLCRSNYIQKI